MTDKELQTQMLKVFYDNRKTDGMHLDTFQKKMQIEDSEIIRIVKYLEEAGSIKIKYFEAEGWVINFTANITISGITFFEKL